MFLKDVLHFLEAKLGAFPRHPLCQAPTPCHRLNSLSHLYGCEVYFKREDLTGFGLGGNKARKMELLIQEAIDHGCDTLVTCGGIQSNFCRVVAAAGAVTGMTVHLILGGKNPKTPSGNLVLNDLLGAHIHYMDSENWDDWEAESEKVGKRLGSKGHKVFRLPIGGAVPVGVIAYVRVFLEILEDEMRMGSSFDEIIHASGSGGTQAGLIVGKEMTGWPGKITGISVAMKGEELQDKLYRLALEGASLLEGKVGRDSIFVDDHFIGPGYGIRTPETKKILAFFARHEGIFLDHVYTGKAAGALVEWLKKNRMSGKSILFIHTGGQPELFAKA